MKRILRIYEEDILQMIQEHFKCDADAIVSVYEEDVDEETGETSPVFYVEVEENARTKK